MEIKKYWLEIICVIIGGSILAINFLVVSTIVPSLAPMLNIIGALIAVVPSLWIFYSKHTRAKEMESQFMVFVLDFTGAIDSGMSLPMALKYCGKREYGVLTPHVKSMAAQIDWGVPFKEALSVFSRKIGSLPVKRAITTIIETHEVGGRISDTLKAVSESLMEISKIKAERSVSVQSQIMTSYLIYFVFIFILVILQTFLIPALTTAGTAAPIGIGVPTPSPQILSPQVFTNFIIVQGFFAGLATGKMAEGSFVAGLKHSIVLIVIGYTIFSFSAQLQITFF